MIGSTVRGGRTKKRHPRPFNFTQGKGSGRLFTNYLLSALPTLNLYTHQQPVHEIGLLVDKPCFQPISIHGIGLLVDRLTQLSLFVHKIGVFVDIPLIGNKKEIPHP